MKFQLIYAVALTYAFAGLATAGSLDIPNTFVSGETARAADVNDNFTAVKTEVDDNNARINQNESAMSFKQERVSGSCPAGQSIRVINSNGSVTCEPDDNTNTTYTAGSGLNLTGTEFSADPVATQIRVSGTCPAGESIRVINQDGSVGCEVDTDTDTNTTYSAGSGLNLNGTVFSADSTATQKRVSGTCPAGQSINVINQDGSVTCEVDTDTTYSAGSGLELNAGVFTTKPTETQKRVDHDCAAGFSIRVINEDGTVVCEEDTDTDTNTTYSAGSGLILTGTEFTIDPSVAQNRVTDSCPAGKVIDVIEAGGTVVCKDDIDTTYSAGSGLILNAGVFTTDDAVTQKRGTVSVCSPPQKMTGIGVDGDVDCDVDIDTNTTYGAAINKGLTLDGTDFRLADGWVSVPPSAFVPTLQGCPAVRNSSEFYFSAIVGVIDCDAVAPLNLPQNATINFLECTVSDEIATDPIGTVPNTLSATLKRVRFDDGTVQTLFITGDSKDTPPVRQILDDTIAGVQVDNGVYTYSLRVDWSTTNFFSTQTFRWKIHGCRVQYSYQ